MRKIIYFLITLMLIGCEEQSSEFKVFSKDIKYKYVQIGEKDSIQQTDVLQLQLMVLNEAFDTLHFVHDFHYFLQPQRHVLDSAFRSFSIGDSILLKVNRSVFNDFFKFYKVLQADTGVVNLSVRIVNALKKEDAQIAEQKAISRRELEEQAALQTFLKSQDGRVDTLSGGVFRQVLIENDSTQIQFGSQVSIHYKGYFLDGYVFDDTWEKSVTPTFTFGQEYQMIEGFQTALSGRKEGERLKIILPSRHAFGEEGSLAGIVPPYTAVIYDVNIIKVIN